MCELPDDNVEVFYGDYGDKRTISRQELYQLPQRFTELPFQAIECGLAYVQPRGNDSMTWFFNRSGNEGNVTALSQ